jgi:hypothetical protein
MNISKEVGTKLWFFHNEIMDFIYKPDDGTIARKLTSDHPELADDYIKHLADKAAFIKRVKQLTGIDPEKFIDVHIKIIPRLTFDVTDCVINAMDAKEKTFFIYIFAENIDKKVANEVADDFNNIDMNSKIFIVPRKKLIGLTDDLDLFLNDYVSYLSKKTTNDNVLKVNPSKLTFVLGAGCSTDANIGNWKQLNDALSFELLSCEDNYGLTNYGSKDVNESVLKVLLQNFDKNSLIDIAIRKKKDIDDKTLDYFQYVHDILYMNYDESKLDYRTDILTAISSCIKRIKMKKIITYNFDSTLEKNINESYHSSSEEVRNAQSSVKYDKTNVKIFHVHGYLPYDYDGTTKVSNFILSDIDFYDNALKIDGNVNSIQKDLMNTNDVIFIGCSFNDSNLKQILLSLDENRTNKIYAVIKTPSFDDLINLKKKKEAVIAILKYKLLVNHYFNYYGVKTIWVKDFNNIPTLLNHIKKSKADIEINVDNITDNK